MHPRPPVTCLSRFTTIWRRKARSVQSASGMYWETLTSPNEWAATPTSTTNATNCPTGETTAPKNEEGWPGAALPGPPAALPAITLPRPKMQLHSRRRQCGFRGLAGIYLNAKTIVLRSRSHTREGHVRPPSAVREKLGSRVCLPHHPLTLHLPD